MAATVTGPTMWRGRGPQGATDMEIHDAVLIAAAFCMFNRYVDGLAMFTPTDLGVVRPDGSAYGERRLCPRRFLTAI